jgi:hypothetical protein
MSSNKIAINNSPDLTFEVSDQTADQIIGLCKGTTAESLRDLIYLTTVNKKVSVDTKYKLLQIASGKSVLEDLLNLVACLDTETCEECL